MSLGDSEEIVKLQLSGKKNNKKISFSAKFCFAKK